MKSRTSFGIFLIVFLAFGVSRPILSAEKFDYSKVANLQDKNFLKYVESLNIKGQEALDFFKGLPISKANKQIYDRYQKDGFEFYLGKYPSGEFVGGFQFKIGMGLASDCPLAKHAVKYPFSDYIPLQEGPVGDPNKTYRIGYTIHGWEHPWLINNAGSAVYEASRHPNVKVTVLDPGWDDAKQVSHIDTWIAQGFDGIMVWPRVEAPMGPPVDRAIKAGIPVISVDRMVGTENVTHRITGNFPANGTQCAMYVVDKLLKESGKVEGKMLMIRQSLGGTADSMRTGHFLKVMSYFPGIEIVGNYHNQSSRSEAFKQVSDALMANPVIDIMWFTYSTGAVGGCEAIDLAKRWNSRKDGRKIIIVAPDDGHDALTAIEKDQIDAIAPYVGFLGDLGLRVILKTLTGEKMPKEIKTPDINLVTKEKGTIFGVPTMSVDEWRPYCYGPPIK